MSTADVYDRYHSTLWRAWNVRFRAQLRRAYPRTDGIEVYVHNWIVCNRERPADAAQAQALISAGWARWHRISARGKREYDRADHGRHTTTFRPLWCNYCKAA